MLLGFGLLLAIGFLAEVFREYEPRKLSILFFPLFWAPLTALHELGHAAAARACGWTVDQVVVGAGRIVYRTQRGGTRIDFRAVPLTGYVATHPKTPRRARLANAFIYFAGPGIELLAVVLVVMVVGYDTLTTATSSVPMIALQTACVAALTGAIINLIPHVGPSGNWSDGLGVLMSPMLTEAHFAERALAPALIRLTDTVRRGEGGSVEDELDQLVRSHPTILTLHLLHAAAQAQTGARAPALINLQALRREAGRTKEELRRIDWTIDQIRAGRPVVPP